MSLEPFDMSHTVRHPDVIHARIDSVIAQIRYHRLAIEAREQELRQLNDIARAMLLNRET